MNYLQRRETTPEYLMVALEQKKVELSQLSIKTQSLEADWRKKTEQLGRLSQQLEETRSKLSRETINLNAMNKKLQNSVDALQAEKGELEFTLENLKKQMAKMQADHSTQARNKGHELASAKEEFELTKSDLNEKIRSLEATLGSLNQAYSLHESIRTDREQLVKDFHRQTASEPIAANIRATLLQNQQLTNELQFQSKQTVNLLERNEKLQEQVAHYKREVEIHKQVEGDLVKRSSLSQTLVKQLNKKLKDMEVENKSLREQLETDRAAFVEQTHQNRSERSLKDGAEQEGDQKNEIRRLNNELSNARNSVNYLENRLLQHETKYESLAVILSQYLQILMLGHQRATGVYGDINKQPDELPLTVEINMSEIKQKPLKEWRAVQTETVVHLLLEQIRPLMSVISPMMQKKNLASFPDTKNINVSLVEEASKQPINLPKISSQYESIVEGEKKKQNRFKDVPLDISTKIVRSDLRGWGQRVELGPIKRTGSIVTKEAKKSNSVYEHKSMLAP